VQAGLIAVAADLAVDLVEKIADVRQQSVKRKLGIWFRELADALHLSSPDEAHRLLLEDVDKPWARDGVLKAVRAIVEDIDEAALPFLARVVAVQREDGRVDPRTRRFVNMLLETDHQMIGELQVFLEHSDVWSDDDQVFDPIEVVIHSDNHEGRSYAVASPGKLFLEGEQYRRALGLLRRYGFVGENALSDEYVPGDTHGTLDSSDHEFLSRLLTVPNDPKPSS
jgi:hypothetical protein